MFKNFLFELRSRNVRKTMAIYLSTALTTVGVVKLFTEVYDLPATIFKIVAVLLTSGSASAFIVAWYHGGEGTQKPQKKEWALHTIILIAAILLSVRVMGLQKTLSRVQDDRTIAVLPFTNMSDRKEDEYFSDGIMEDILTQLSKISDLRVISRTSVMKFKDSPKTIREIGEELGVAAILEGSVRREGMRVKIVGALINSTTDERIWEATYEREIKDIFAIQGEVARSIAGELKAQLSPDEVARVTAEPTKNLDAYALFLRGRDYRNRRNNEDNERAIELLRKAIDLDRSYSLAYSELAMAYTSRYLAHGYSSIMADSGITLGLAAVELDPRSPEAYHSVGKGYEAQGKLSLALQYYNNAIAISPNYAPAVASLGWVAFGIGKLDDALEWMRKSIALAPDAASRYISVGTMYNFMGVDSLALLWYRKGLELQDDLIVAHWSLVYFYLYQARLDEARAHVRAALDKFPTDVSILHAAGDIELIGGNAALARDYYQKSVGFSSYQDGPGNQLAFTLLKLGKTHDAKAILDSNLVVYKRGSGELPEDFNNPLAVATIHAIRNNADEALPWLRVAIERGSRDYRWLMVEPLFGHLRTDPRFLEMMSDLHKRIEAMRHSAEARGLFRQ